MYAEDHCKYRGSSAGYAQTDDSVSGTIFTGKLGQRRQRRRSLTPKGSHYRNGVTG
jgi:hypothetical protein